MKKETQSNDTRNVLHSAIIFSTFTEKTLYDNLEKINEPDSYGNTPLHFAARFDRTGSNALNLLLGVNADVNWENQFKETPLHLAVAGGSALVQGNSPLIVGKLLKAGANPNLTDNLGRTVLDCLNFHVKLLEEKKDKNKNIRNYLQVDSPHLYKLLESYGAKASLKFPELKQNVVPIPSANQTAEVEENSEKAMGESKAKMKSPGTLYGRMGTEPSASFGYFSATSGFFFKALKLRVVQVIEKIKSPVISYSKN